MQNPLNGGGGLPFEIDEIAERGAPPFCCLCKCWVRKAKEIKIHGCTSYGFAPVAGGWRYMLVEKKQESVGL
jgi:hypothetical protein